ncbi:MAG: hypothetical protein PWP60_874 [Candidatus Atribacteria bacterium]|jgi:uncharacterized ferredoxin-like protein|uniref:ferredoxin domain-containing protein n=1 Tax=Atrimonas thermophila TaxID=3064161 RepID=UPI0024AC50D9|nr:hypothetical protein [Candidatus Atribacteria bacterium]
MQEAIKQVAHFMAIAARTAPKTKGEDFVTVRVLDKEETQKLGEAMINYGKEKGIAGFVRDGQNVKDSEAVLLLGIKDATPAGLNCGACGFSSCSELQPKEMKDFKGPQCVLRALDLGIALGSAVKTASIFNVDNRIMYRIGVVARLSRMCDDDLVMGIPLSAYGKNIYFDRKG